MTTAPEMLSLFLRNVAAFAEHASPNENGSGWRDVAATIMTISAANLESTEATDAEWHKLVSLLGDLARRELDHANAAGPYSRL